MAFLKKTAQMTFLKKKTWSKAFSYAKFGGYCTYGSYVLHTALLLFFCETQLCYLLSAVLNKELGLGGLIIRFRRCSPQTEWQETHQTGTSFKEAIFENERLSFSRIIQISIYHNETIYIVFSNISNWTLWDVTNWLSLGEIKTNLSFTWKIKFLHEVLLYEGRRQVYIPRTE